MLHVNEAASKDRETNVPVRAASDDDVFEVLFTGPSGAFRAIKMEGGLGWRPPMNVYETEGEMIVQVELAGLDKNEIIVEVEGKLLTIRGHRREAASGTRRHYHKLEIGVGKFERHVRLPANVDSTQVRAKYESGYLFVIIADGDGSASERTSIDIES